MRKAIATAVVGLGVCLPVFAAPAAAAPHELFGLSKGQPLVQRDYKKMKATGVHSFRFAINWPSVQPNSSAHNFPDQPRSRAAYVAVSFARPIHSRGVGPGSIFASR